VAQVGGQSGQQALNVSALPIPGNQTMNGKSVPEIMKAWLITSPIVTQHTGSEAQLTKCVFRGTSG
jgi:hypothetical protein